MSIGKYVGAGITGIALATGGYFSRDVDWQKLGNAITPERRENLAYKDPRLSKYCDYSTDNRLYYLPQGLKSIEAIKEFDRDGNNHISPEEEQDVRNMIVTLYHNREYYSGENLLEGLTKVLEAQALAKYKAAQEK